jgi:hypothetical protein
VFSGRPAKGRVARLQLEIIRRSFLGIHRLIRFKDKDLSVKRAALKRHALRIMKKSAQMADRTIVGLSSLEWKYLSRRKSGTAQYLVFKKV